MTDAITIEIFDPPMCCSGGLCGPDIDPALLAIQETILLLKSEHGDRISIERYLLSKQPDKFASNPSVLRLLQDQGVSVLPITVVNSEILKCSEYPSYMDLEQIISAGRSAEH